MTCEECRAALAMAQAANVAFLAEIARLRESAGLPTGDAARRVFRKVTTLESAQLGFTLDQYIETDKSLVFLAGLLPKECNRGEVRGTFRVVVEFTPDGEK